MKQFYEDVPNGGLSYRLKITVLLLASSRFSHKFGHHASREAAVTWQKLAAACSDLAQYSANQAKKQKSTAKVCQMRETGGQKQATAWY